MALVVACFFTVFGLVASAGFLLIGKKAAQPVTAVIKDPSLAREAHLLSTIQQASVSLGGMVGHFEGVIPKSQAEVSILRQRLIKAGYRKDSALSIFYGAKFVLMIVSVVAVYATRVASYNYIFVTIAALAFGFLAPDFWLGRHISGRQRRIRMGLPDVLDLLVVCVEAGLSLDQAVMRTAEELESASPVLSDELKIVVREQRAGCPRGDAWKHLAERTDLDVVRKLVTMLIQSEQFGTSIA